MPWEELPQADAIILAVAHSEYKEMDNKKLLSKAIQGGSFIDVKAQFNRSALEAEGVRVWRL
jgi:UDP-N-acetyl-D-galactosamine dehydrogenase